MGQRRVPAFQTERFMRRFASFSEIGQTKDGAIHRPFGSDADLAARAWLMRLAEEVGLSVSVDAIGNIWGVLPGRIDQGAIVIGSHHDSVPDGGRFDGPLGVLMGIEVIQSLQESGYPNEHPLAFVSFTAEEPNPFDLSTLGSRSVAGRLTHEKLLAATDWNGRPLREAVDAAGGDLQAFATVRKTANDIAAFLELHIEQGRRLETRDIPIGLVTGICGIYRESIRATGEANHAGTTRLEDRRDALLASSEMLLAVERMLTAWNDDEIIATIGRLNVIPNAMNIIPGECEWSLEIRGGDMARVYSFRDACIEAFDEIAARRGVRYQRQLLLDQQPQPMAADVVDVLHSAAADFAIPYLDLASMAGHDATHIASFTRAGMVFVPSIGGKSHCKEEESRIEDIEHAFYVLAAASIALDSKLTSGGEIAHEETV
ncbi:M20 family metallo-hydrolase [Alicyclobacillus fastidiosus]|uniref:M20 family metallo-hydrolase n=1 Tax=Alicyclobacillus fastidiosus TaxID=392011 RepID=A0ABY6ZBY6_9BACL|nr:M20 family metallo-hydrolase [Alicyclobacillus fastidiosus]WAH39719.1 M20 family metallo-hydrolase [Alicyclobacillus fastidiosus]GMA60944.1 Zn-dependent hydrolase [Alicyclobacillus fastidiosus]